MLNTVAETRDTKLPMFSQHMLRSREEERSVVVCKIIKLNNIIIKKKIYDEEDVVVTSITYQLL